MATVIDALVVEFGLDPTKFTSGQKEVVKDIKDLGEQNKKLGDQIEKSAKGAAEQISKMRNQVLALFAIFTAGRGIKEFLADVIATDNQLGRLAPQLHETTQELSQWRGAAVAVGGTADGITGSIQGLVSQFQTFALTGESSVVPYFRALGVNITTVDGHMRKMSAVLLDLADKFHDMDPARAAAFGKALGFDQGTINLLIQGRAAVQGLLDEQERLGTISPEDAKAGAELNKQLAELSTVSTSLGRTLLTILAPALIFVLKVVKEIAVFLLNHKPLLVGVFTALTVVALAFSAAMLAGFAGATLAAITGGMALIVGGLSGLSLLFATLTATALPALSEAFLALGAAIEMTPVGWIITAIAGIAAVVYLLFTHLDDLKRLWDSFWSDKETKQAGSEVVGKAPGKGAILRSGSTGASAPRQRPGTSHPTTPSSMNRAADSAIDYVMRNEDPTLSGKVTSDTGGLTKYGISQKANPEVDIANLTVEGARAIYKKKYWDLIGGDKLPANMQRAALDAAINEGVGKTKQFLQQSGGDLAKFQDLRRQHYEGLAQQNPAKYGKYLQSWENRLGPSPGAAAGVQIAREGSKAAGSAKNGGNISHSNSHSETNIREVNVYTQANDAAGIARDIKPALQRDAFAAQSDAGAT